MKKKGFTLAEALIVIGIIGVISAVTTPIVNKLKPDTNKVKYLKVYDTLNEAVFYFTNSTSFYPIAISGETREAYKNINYQTYPLYNTVGVTDADSGIQISEGDKKFCEILAITFGATNVNCAQTNFASATPSFSTKNGADFIVKTTTKAPSGGKGYFKSEILLDVDELSEGKNCQYSTSCPNPDRFEFVVYADGEIYAKDDKGRAYLTKRSNWRKSDEDISEFSYNGENTDLETFNLVYSDTQN